MSRAHHVFALADSHTCTADLHLAPSIDSGVAASSTCDCMCAGAGCYRIGLLFCRASFRGCNRLHNLIILTGRDSQSLRCSACDPLGLVRSTTAEIAARRPFGCDASEAAGRHQNTDFHGRATAAGNLCRGAQLALPALLAMIFTIWMFACFHVGEFSGNVIRKELLGSCWNLA